MGPGSRQEAPSWGTSGGSQVLLLRRERRAEGLLSLRIENPSSPWSKETFSAAAVLLLENFELLSRVRNKPYDVFGCWLNETNLISSNLHRIGFLTSCSVLWLNNAFQVN